MDIDNGMHIDSDLDIGNGVHIDCDTCEVRGRGCGDCVVTVLLGSAPEGVVISDDEQAALAMLADSGLVPPLRMRPNARSRQSGT
jgi:hypothetical protein